jgi:cytoskeletal protein CcmA (bactofilin family)
MLALGLMLALGPSTLSAQEAGPTILKRGVIAEDVYASGGRVDILAEVDGDVVAAGGRVSVGRLVKGDVIAAGGDVSIAGKVLDDVRAAGGLVTIDAHIAGDAVAAGGSVSLRPESQVDGKAWLVGGDIEVHGTVGKRLRAAGGRIRIAGDVHGDVDLVARRIEILPGARITGSLTYRSPQEAKIDPAAHIGGTLTRLPAPARLATVSRGVAWIAGVVFLASLMVSGIVLLLLFPNFSTAAARTVATDPWKSLGMGIAVLVATPVAAGLLMSTLLGMPLGLTILSLYFVSLLWGFLTAATFVGDLGIRLFRGGPSKGWRVLSLIAALVVLAIIGAIPIVGAVILFLALLFGLGAWTVHGYRTYARARDGGAA